MSFAENTPFLVKTGFCIKYSLRKAFFLLNCVFHYFVLKAEFFWVLHHFVLKPVFCWKYTISCQNWVLHQVWVEKGVFCRKLCFSLVFVKSTVFLCFSLFCVESTVFLGLTPFCVKACVLFQINHFLSKLRFSSSLRWERRFLA